MVFLRFFGILLGLRRSGRLVAFMCSIFVQNVLHDAEFWRKKENVHDFLIHDYWRFERRNLCTETIYTYENLYEQPKKTGMQKRCRTKLKKSKLDHEKTYKKLPEQRLSLVLFLLLDSFQNNRFPTCLPPFSAKYTLFLMGFQVFVPLLIWKPIMGLVAIQCVVCTAWTLFSPLFDNLHRGREAMQCRRLPTLTKSYRTDHIAYQGFHRFYAGVCKFCVGFCRFVFRCLYCTCL